MSSQGQWSRRIGAALAAGAFVLLAPVDFHDGSLTSSAFAQQGQGAGGPNNSAGGGPGNEGAAAGGQGTSTGPGARSRARSGGGGGGNGNGSVVPSAIGGDSDALIGGGDKSNPEAVMGPDWCADYKPGTGNTSERVSGQNLKRLDTVRRMVVPEIDRSAIEKRGFPLYNLALYQEVLEAAEPDTVLAGTYLGLTAAVPVSDDIVARTNALLCVKANEETMRRIAKIAEEQRLSMR